LETVVGEGDCRAVYKGSSFEGWEESSIIRTFAPLTIDGFKIVLERLTSRKSVSPSLDQLGTKGIPVFEVNNRVLFSVGHHLSVANITHLSLSKGVALRDQAGMVVCLDLSFISKLGVYDETA